MQEGKKLDLGARLVPVVQELLEPDIRQRMLHEHLEDRERHGRHVRARLGRVDDVQRVADRRRQHLRLETVDAVDLTDIAHQVHADRGDVIETAEKWADVRRPRLRGEEGLGCREAERLVDPYPLARQMLDRLEPILGQGALDHGVRGDLGQLFALFDHAVEVRRHHLEAHVSRGDDGADLLHERPEGSLLLGDERGVGGAAVHQAHGHALAKLRHIGGVEKDLHENLLLGSVPYLGASPAGWARSTCTRVPARTVLKTVASPTTLPNTFTGLAGRISSPRLDGVGPKKMQKAEPGGQYPRSPMSTVSRGFSGLALTGIEK